MKRQIALTTVHLSFALILTASLSVNTPLAVDSVYPKITASDLDFDGLSDLLLASPEGRVALLYNQGDAGFFESETFTGEANSCGQVVVGEISSDGNPDVMILHPQEGSVSAVEGLAFDPSRVQTLQNLGSNPTRIAVGGPYPDRAAIGWREPGAITFIAAEPALPHAELTVTKTTIIGTPVIDIGWGDLEGDGRQELIVLAGDKTQQVLVLRQAGMSLDAEWEAAESIDIPGDSIMTSLAVGWFNNDFTTDIAVWNESGNVTAFLSDPNNQFTLQSFNLNPSSTVRALDMTGDLVLDFVSLSENRAILTAFLNDGKLNFHEFQVTESEAEIQDFTFGQFAAWPRGQELLVWTQNEGNQNRFQLFKGFSEANIQPEGELDLPYDPAEEIPSGFETLFVYKQQDWQEGNPYPYWSYRVPDWTTSANLVNGTIRTGRDVFGQNGLEEAASEAVPNPDLPDELGPYVIQVNQIAPDVSFFSLSGIKEARSIRLQAAPPAGLYHHTITVSPVSEEDVSIQYRINNDSWGEYNVNKTEIILYQDANVSFKASKNGYQSPILTERYLIDQPAYADSDLDGIPDKLEVQFELPILSQTLDLDDDGWNDLDELIRESDPKNVNSVPMNQDRYDLQNLPADLWSDFDETARETNWKDHTSQGNRMKL